jgi:O-antigen biosynthesis protein
MTNNDKTLSIVIPVFNKWNFTKSALADLRVLPLDHEIIVVDNGSTDETKDILPTNGRIVYHRCSPNLGFAKACNIGYRIATAPNVLFLNNDIRVKSDHKTWTQNLLPFCSQGLVGPTMGQLDDKLHFVQEANRLLPGNSYMSGWCLAASKEIWEKLNIRRYQGNPYVELWGDGNNSPQIFSEEFGLAYFEDTDLSFRARKLGIPMQVVDVPVAHFGKQTSKQLNVPKLYSEARQIFLNKWGHK